MLHNGGNGNFSGLQPRKGQRNALPLCNLNDVNLIYDMKNYFITLVSTFTVPSA